MVREKLTCEFSRLGAKYDWQDPLMLELDLTEEERMIRDQVRQYCDAKLMPRVLEANRHEKFDPTLM